MRYSQLYTKTNKAAKEFDSLNATLLIKAGYIHQLMAGVYTFLPLGLRVLTKIENIIREEMDQIGTEILMPALSPKKNWEITGRIETVDVLFKVSGANLPSQQKNSAEYILNCTQEDIVTPVAQQFIQSYKDLPAAFYQIQNKFRNEPRAKSGLMRGREFRMKDLYSFHASEADLQDYYHNKAKPAYVKVFKRLGLGKDTFITLASGGDFTKDFSHEFQTRCESGEDLVFHDTVNDIYYNREVTPSQATDPGLNDEPMQEMKEILGEGMIGVADIAQYLNITKERTTKTLFFHNEKGEFIVAAVRGDYEIDLGKLKKITSAKELELSTESELLDVLHTKPGYVGIVNLPENLTVIIDESCDHRKNFECGANKINYHSTNVNWDRDLPKPEKFYDIKVAKKGDLHPDTHQPYEVFKASEVGNIFPLNTKYSKAFGFEYTDEKGQRQDVYMGSYGIGSSRLMGVLVEKFHDENGIIWPEAVAPFQVHLIGLNLDDPAIKAKIESIYLELTTKNIEVLFDDRVDASTGNKLADADLIGIPYRVIISRKTGEQLEVKRRDSKEIKMMSSEELIKKFQP
ncbi:MAG: proline--tRNA ligase [bacterium]